MSKKNEKSRRRNRKLIRVAKKKKKAIKRQKLVKSRKLNQQKIANVVEQPARRAAFDASAWQTSKPSNNIQHGTVEDTVLDGKVGFDKTAWTPTSDPPSDVQEQHENSQQSGFDVEAWKIQDGKATNT